MQARPIQAQDIESMLKISLSMEKGSVDLKDQERLNEFEHEFTKIKQEKEKLKKEKKEEIDKLPIEQQAKKIKEIDSLTVKEQFTLVCCLVKTKKSPVDPRVYSNNSVGMKLISLVNLFPRKGVLALHSFYQVEEKLTDNSLKDYEEAISPKETKTDVKKTDARTPNPAQLFPAANVAKQEDKEFKNELRKIDPLHRVVLPEDVLPSGRLKITPKPENDEAERKKIIEIVEKIAQHLQKENREDKFVFDIGKNELFKLDLLYNRRYNKIPNFEKIRDELPQLIAKPTCSVKCFYENGAYTLWWKYKGKGVKQYGEESIYYNFDQDNGHLLGTGGYAKVKLMQRQQQDNKNDKKFDALRIVAKKKMGSLLKQYEKIYAAGKALPGAPYLFASERNSPSKAQDQIETVMSVAPGRELLDLINTRWNGKFRLPAWFWFKVIFNVLDTVMKYHDSGFIHNDIKLENMMVWKIFTSLIDPDLATRLPKGQKSVQVDDQEHGTAGYVDPQSLKKKGMELSPSSDGYSVSLVLAALLGLGYVRDDRFKESTQSHIKEAGIIPLKHVDEVNKILETLRHTEDKKREDLKGCRAALQGYYIKHILPDAVKAGINVCVIDLEEAWKNGKLNKENLDKWTKDKDFVYLAEFGVKHDENIIAQVFQYLSSIGKDNDQVVSLAKRDDEAMQKMINADLDQMVPEIQKRNYALKVSKRNEIPSDNPAAQNRVALRR